MFVVMAAEGCERFVKAHLYFYQMVQLEAEVVKSGDGRCCNCICDDVRQGHNNSSIYSIHIRLV